MHSCINIDESWSIANSSTPVDGIDIGSNLHSRSNSHRFHRSFDHPLSKFGRPVFITGIPYENKEGATLDITTQVQRAVDNVKKLGEGAGGTMDHVLQLTVYLASLEFYDAMNRAYRPYFPNGGPARCTVSVAGIPGKSLVEISCIAAVVRH